MIEPKEKSLKIIKNTIFERIKNIMNKILKSTKENNKIKLEKENYESKKQEAILEMENELQGQENLIKKIETDKIKVEEQKDEELEQINANLARYLEKIQKEMGNSKTEKSAVKIQS